MKKMKKWLALGLAAVMVLSMTACGGSGDAAGDGGRIPPGKAAAVRMVRRKSPWQCGTEAGERTCRRSRKISTAITRISIWISRCRPVTTPISSAQR